MTDHAGFEEQICALLDGELSAAEEAALRAHLDECADCRAFLAAMEAVYGLTAKDLPEAPADLTQNVMTRVRAEAGKTKKPGKVLRFPVRPLAAAAAAALVLWAGARALPMFSPKGMSASAPAAAGGAETAGSTVTSDSTVAADMAVPEEAPPEAAMNESALFAAENKAAVYGDAAPEEVGETEAAAAPMAPDAGARDVGAAPTITIRGSEILFGERAVTLEELGERLREADAGQTGAELVFDAPDEATAEAVSELLRSMEIPVL